MGGDVGEKPGIWKGLGSSFVKISTSSIDQLIHNNDEATLAKAKAFTYAENGNYFAVFSIGDDTFVYDATTSALAQTPHWHQRQTGIGNGDNFFTWRAQHGVLAFGKILVGDDRSGKVGQLDLDTFTEYGDNIERLVSTRPFIERGQTIYNHEIELFMQTGLGDATTTDPQIRMDYSDDGGRNWSNEISRSMGKVGEFKTRVRWSRLGRIPNTRTLRFKTTEPVPVNIYSLFSNSEVTDSG
jgi:hypothetical protein